MRGSCGVLQPAVGVGDPVAVQVLDQIEAFGAGIAGSTHARRGYVTRPASAARGGQRRAPSRSGAGPAGADVRRDRLARPGRVGPGCGAPNTVRIGSTPAHRPPAAMSSSSSPGGPVRTLTLASARSSANTAVAASSRRPGSRACVPGAGGELLDDGVQRGPALVGVGDQAGGAVHDRAAVVHRVVEHRAGVDDPVQVGDGQADRAAVEQRAGSRRRSSRARRRCRRCGRSRWAARPARRRGPRRGGRSARRRARRTGRSRSVRARSRSRVTVLRRVVERLTSSRMPAEVAS